MCQSVWKIWNCSKAETLLRRLLEWWFCVITELIMSLVVQTQMESSQVWQQQDSYRNVWLNKRRHDTKNSSDDILSSACTLDKMPANIWFDAHIVFCCSVAVKSTADSKRAAKYRGCASESAGCFWPCRAVMTTLWVSRASRSNSASGCTLPIKIHSCGPRSGDSTSY